MIINRNSYSKCLFADLSTGDCFIIDDCIFIKVSKSLEGHNAFNCEYNVLMRIANNTLVQRIDIELTEV